MLNNPEHPRKLWFWWLVFIALVAIIFLLIANFTSFKKPISSVQPGYYSVNHFVDGDTVTVNMNGSVETIRMIGVDTPETHHPDRGRECYGNEAADFTEKLIGKSKVRLQADPLDTNRDRYGRLLRYVYLPDGTLIEEKLISEGYAFAYIQFPFEKSFDFSAKEQAAKDKKIGLWAACQIITEPSGLKHTNPSAQ